MTPEDARAMLFNFEIELDVLREYVVRNFQIKRDGYRRLIYIPKMIDYDQLEGQLRPGEYMCVLTTNAVDQKVARLTQMVPATYEELNPRLVIGFYAITPVIKEQIFALRII